MAVPKLRFATHRRYDTKFLMDGVVQVEGFDIEYLDYRGPGGMTGFFRDMVTVLSYDIGEQAFAHYMIAKDQGKPITAIPVFPSRLFPLTAISVNKNSSVRSPRDLVGKKVGAPDWGFNPAVWMRGILAHQYDVPVERITWLVNENEPLFRGLNYPHSKRFEIKTIQLDDDAAAHGFPPLLESGVVDAVIHAGGGIPPTEGCSKLFEQPYQEIRAYVAEAGVFPINTVITLKDSVVKAHPELPGRLMEAWRKAQRYYDEELRSGKETHHMGLEVEVLREMNLFPQEYGLYKNRRAIQMMIQYCYEQGLIQTLFEPEDLFVEIGR